MANNVLCVRAVSGSTGVRRGPPSFFAGPKAGKERRLEIQVFVSSTNKIMVSRAWEHSVWRDAQVVIAESPAPHLSTAIEAVLQTVASDVALGAGWIGMGRITFSLDNCSKEFCVISNIPGRDALMHLPVTAIPTGHASALHIKGDSQSAIDVLICGTSRGDALRRAYMALSNLPAADNLKRRLLMNRIASKAFCEGLTGSRLDQNDPANLAL